MEHAESDDETPAESDDETPARLNYAVYARELQAPREYVMCWAFWDLCTAEWFCRNRSDVGRLELRRREFDKNGGWKEEFLDAFHE